MDIFSSLSYERSAELKVEYEQLKVQQERATENSAFNFNKKRGINAEIKQYQEQRAEAERFEQLQNDKVYIDNNCLYHFSGLTNSLFD